MNPCILMLCLALGVPAAPGAPAAPDAVLAARTRLGVYGEARPAALRRPGPPDPPRDSWLGEDKLKHFAVSFVVTSLAASGARAAGLSRDASTLVGAGTGVGVGAWKEWRDRSTAGSTPSFRDFAWDAAGVGVAAAVQQQTR
ncbi:hypothetical protein [Longimicrobium terrae]|uniref:Uncharacterized protein YfiM (DUF2279 family) n=1 Tax=Longimicrobium terrae TaxID=1639882 RepID=A0A841H4H9_9BACT|nr:hypothetical protein [Longimicrobium terrae]MBB4638792.1 uncharacterized protein YfiM (DUF2279 family) [Longimicrobium terrae]MBB6073031.1 uncharacterized protein YfiM (DUF2279 family) [Longimicrobium terrae]NNC33154.1 hypothetical protein [Longimicrobium terrae]